MLSIFKKRKYSPKTNEELREAIINYPSNKNKLGHISTWDVRKVTDMTGIFHGG